MTAGAVVLDDEAIGTRRRVLREERGQSVGRDDGDEARPDEAGGATDDLGRVEAHGVTVVRSRARHCDPVGDLLAASQTVEEVGHVRRDPRPHKHVVDARQQGAVEGIGRRHLDLFQVVDTDRTVMPPFGELHLGEIGEDGELAKRPWGLETEHRHGAVRLAGWAPSGDKPPVEHTPDQRGLGEGAVGPSQVTAWIAVAEPSRVDRLQSGP